MTSRVTIPSEFYDRTSAMMLVQPEPQYLWARMLFMGSAQAELRRVGGSDLIGSGRLPIAEGAGPVTKQFEEMQLMLADNIRSEAIFVTDELAPEKIGHTIRINRPTFANSTYTAAVRTIGSTDTISTTPISITGEQTSITILRYAGPYDQTNSRVAPYSIDRMDAEHSVHSLVQLHSMHLVRDRMRFVNATVQAKFFPPTPNQLVYPGDSAFALSADSSAFTASTNNDRPMDAETLFRAIQKLQDANIPPFANGKYMCVVSPQQARQLRSDPLIKAQVFDASLNPLRNAVVTMMDNIEVYVDTTAPTDTATVSGVTINKAVVFGPGMVGYANAGPCRAAFANEDNYGETAKVIWLAYEGLTTLDNRFSVEIHSN